MTSQGFGLQSTSYTYSYTYTTATTVWAAPHFATPQGLAESACRRLCLDPERTDEVVAAAIQLDMWPLPRERWFTLWWDTAS